MSQLSSDGLKDGMDPDAIDDKKAAIEARGSVVDLDAKTKARILRKMDWHLLPLVTSMYFLSFLDRGNIGNAKIAGMGKDLDLVGLRYNTAVAVFFVTYSLGQLPSNIILKFVRPSRWIPLTMVAWGLVMTLMYLVKTYHQLLVARLFLGLTEAGLLPGVTYYISLWYPRAVRGKRYAIFTSAAALAGIFSGILAYLIEKMEGIGGLRGWQWIFCLEGIATVLLAFTAAFFMCDSPETASFLTEDEKCYVVELMKVDSQGLATHYDFQFVLQALKDYKTYHFFVIYISLIVPGFALAFFVPIIINELGFSVSEAQLLTVAPGIATFLCSILAGIFSDKQQLRGPYMAAGAFVGLVGCAILYTEARPGVALLGIVIASMGIFPPIPIGFAWITSNTGGEVKRAVALSTVTGLKYLGGICASYIFFDPPRFHVGLGISMGLLGCSMLLSCLMMWNLNRLNKQKERRRNEQGITDAHKDEFSEIGDDSPLFIYTL